MINLNQDTVYCVLRFLLDLINMCLHFAYSDFSTDCEKLGAPIHGDVTYSNGRTTYGEVATFTCAIGYYLSHNRTRVCSASSNWDGTTPKCIVQGTIIVVFILVVFLRYFKIRV